MKSKFLLSTGIFLLLLIQSSSIFADDACTIWGISAYNQCYSPVGLYRVGVRGSFISGPQQLGTTFTWNFGDGSPTATNTDRSPSTISHDYASPGSYTISLTYTEPSCATVTVYKVFQVSLVTLNFTASTTTPLLGSPVTLNFEVNNAPYLLNYYLSFDGGATSTPVTSPYIWTPTYTGPRTLTIIANTEGCYFTRSIDFNVICPVCSTATISAVSPICAGNPTHFINGVSNCTGLGSGATDKLLYIWDYGDGTTSTGFAPDHTYTLPGTYTVKLTYQFVGDIYPEVPCSIGNGGTTVVVVGNCPPPPCEDCIGSFAPTAGNYILSTWVKQASGENLITYDKAGVKLTCVTPTGNIVNGPFYPAPSGKIIEGWQRIEQTFSVPVNTSQIKIQLVNSGTTDAYYDDIRIHPVDGNMKSYVYDPITLRLMAELDENNYATFYEYDEEGTLIRVKRETERGIMTIKESRNNSTKQ